MADHYARSAAKVAVTQLAEAAGFDAVQHSAVDTLADLLLRYINEVGSASHGYAELAGRTESNPLDVLLALNDLGVSLGELEDYARVQDEMPYAQSIATFPIRKKPTAVPTFLDKNEVPPSHVPNFLPAFPDKHTYVSTPAFVGHERDPHKRQLKETQARQDAVRAVVKLQARMAPENKLLEARVPSAAGEQEAAAAAANPFLAPTLWENGLDPASVSDEPVAAAAAAAAHAIFPGNSAAAGMETRAPGVGVAAAATGGAGPTTEAAAAADLAGEWQVLAGDGDAQPSAPSTAPLFVSWDWKVHLQKKARLAVSGGEQKDAYGQAYEAHALGTKHGRRAKRTERALAAQLEIGDPTKRRVEEILAARQEEADGGAAEEEPVVAQDQEHI